MDHTKTAARVRAALDCTLGIPDSYEVDNAVALCHKGCLAERHAADMGWANRYYLEQALADPYPTSAHQTDRRSDSSLDLPVRSSHLLLCGPTVDAFQQ